MLRRGGGEQASVPALSFHQCPLSLKASSLHNRLGSLLTSAFGDGLSTIVHLASVSRRSSEETDNVDSDDIAAIEAQSHDSHAAGDQECHPESRQQERRSE